MSSSRGGGLFAERAEAEGVRGRLAGGTTAGSLGRVTDTPAAPGPLPDHPVLTPAGSLGETMGIVVTSASPQEVVATMPVAGNTQPYGLLHGGASVVLAESLGSIGAALHAGEGRIAVGVDINATHHRAARAGAGGDARVRGVATAVHRGRSTASYEVVITDDEGRRVCTSRITCQLMDVPPGA